MSTKYTVSGRERWRLNSGHNVRLSDHALERWDDRTPEDSSSPEHAFDNAVDVSELRENLVDNAGQVPDKAYYWYEKTGTASYGIVFLVHRYPETTDICKTVYKVGFIDHGPTRAYLAAYNHEFEP